jgi:hypothetical protein
MEKIRKNSLSRGWNIADFGLYVNGAETSWVAPAAHNKRRLAKRSGRPSFSYLDNPRSGSVISLIIRRTFREMVLQRLGSVRLYQWPLTFQDRQTLYQDSQPPLLI